MAKDLRKIQTYLNYLYDLDFKEKPISVDRFLRDPRYLGNSTENGRAVYNVWRESLTEVMAEDSKYLAVFTGAIGCLGPDVKVSVLDGRELTIPEIIAERQDGQQHWVYSYDIKRKKIVPGKVTDAMLSGTQVDNIVEIELDNGEKIQCTHNHPFLTIEGVYVHAEDLLPGNSLMPLYREKGSGGYELIGAYKEQWKPTFRRVAEEIYGVPKGYCVHHIDFDKDNNSPENLLVMLIEDHILYHATIASPFQIREGFASECAKKANNIRWNGPNNVENRKAASDRLKKRNAENGQARNACKVRWSAPNAEEEKRKLSKFLKARNAEGQAKRASEKRWAQDGAGKNQSEKMVTYWAVPENRKRVSNALKGKSVGENNPAYGKPAWNRKPRETRECTNIYCDTLFEVRVDSPVKCYSIGCSNKFRAQKVGEIDIKNHKVQSVKRISKKIDVYDLSVEEYHNFALTSGVFVHNTGKTRGAVWGLAYVLYRLLCLKNPWEYFTLAPGGKLSICFFNLTKSLGASTSYLLLQSCMINSPWFLEHGIVRGVKDLYLDVPIFDYKLASPYAQGFGTLGHDIISGLMDEVDSPNESESMKKRVLDAYNNTSRRFISRFVDPMTGETLGKLFIVSSKQEAASFLSTFIVERKNSPEIYVKDVPIWEAKSATNYSGEKIYVMVGDAYNPSKLLETAEELKKTQATEFQIIEVPVEYREAFIQDINGALRDLAGVSVLSARMSKLFASEQVLEDCYDKSKENPAKRSTIMVGLKDKIDLMKYFDFSKIRTPLHYPRFIHCDIAFSGEGDALGLGMSAVSGWMKKNVQLDDGNIEVRRMPVVETDFAIRLKGKPGDQIDLSCVRRFVLDLRLYGFNIAKFTADLRAMSIDTCQILINAGIKAEYLSLDKKPDMYLGFRDLVNEKRWICHKDEYLHFELSNLEDDKVRNKIDHPEKVVKLVFVRDGDMREVVLKGSKDEADGVVGSTMSALENVEVPPDREIIRGLAQKAKQPGAGLLKLPLSEPEEMLQKNIIGTDKKAALPGTQGKKATTKQQMLRDIFNKVR